MSIFSCCFSSYNTPPHPPLINEEDPTKKSYLGTGQRSNPNKNAKIDDVCEAQSKLPSASSLDGKNNPDALSPAETPVAISTSARLHSPKVSVLEELFEEDPPEKLEALPEPAPRSVLLPSTQFDIQLEPAPPAADGKMGPAQMKEERGEHGLPFDLTNVPTRRIGESILPRQRGGLVTLWSIGNPQSSCQFYSTSLSTFS